MHVDVITSRETLLRLRSNWEAVYQADPEAQLFMSWTSIAGWFENLGCQWIILAAKEKPELPDYVAFFPLQLRTERNRQGTFHNELRTGGGYFAGYTGFICDPRHEHAAMRAFADHTKRRNWSRLHLENISRARPDRLALFLNEFSSPPDFVTEKVQRPDDGDGIDHDIYVYVNLPADWDAFLYGEIERVTRAGTPGLPSGRSRTESEFRITHPTADTIEEDVEALLKFWEGAVGGQAGGALQSKTALQHDEQFPRHAVVLFCGRCASAADPLARDKSNWASSESDRPEEPVIDQLVERSRSRRQTPLRPVLSFTFIACAGAFENGFAAVRPPDREFFLQV